MKGGAESVTGRGRPFAGECGYVCICTALACVLRESFPVVTIDVCS